MRLQSIGRSALWFLALVLGVTPGEPATSQHNQTQERLFGRMLLHGDKMAVHSDEPGMLAFFTVPPKTVVLCVDERGDYRVQRSAHPTGGACEIIYCAEEDTSSLPHKEGYSSGVQHAACKKPQVPVPQLIRPVKDWLVVKSPGYVNLDAPFFLAGTEYRGQGEGGPRIPKMPFFRIYGIDGKVLFDLKETASPPEKIVTGLGIDANGALFGVGEFVTFDNGCDSETSPRKIRKLFLWDASGEIQTLSVSPHTQQVSELMRRFRLHESYLPWFKWPPELAQERFKVLRDLLSSARDAMPLVRPIRRIIAEAASDGLVLGVLDSLSGEGRTAFVESAAKAELTRLKRMPADDFREYLKQLEPDEQVDRSIVRHLQHEINCATLDFIRENEKLASLRSDYFERKRWNLCEIGSGMDD